MSMVTDTREERTTADVANTRICRIVKISESIKKYHTNFVKTPQTDYRNSNMPFSFHIVLILKNKL